MKFKNKTDLQQHQQILFKDFFKLKIKQVILLNYDHTNTKVNLCELIST